MKKYTLSFLGLGFSFIAFAVSAIAQSPAADPMAPVELGVFLQALVASIGGFKGGSALAISAIVVQLLVMLSKLDILGGLWAKIPGFWRLIVVMVLTYISGVLSLVASGVSVGAAFVHSTVLSSLMVLGNQLYQQWQTGSPANKT